MTCPTHNPLIVMFDYLGTPVKFDSVITNIITAVIAAGTNVKASVSEMIPHYLTRIENSSVFWYK